MKKWFFLSCLALSTFLIGEEKSSWSSYKAEVLFQQKKVPGWCCREKAEKLMDLIYDTHPKVCVEIGVFGGSSIFPTAKALAYFKSGTVYAIDPWSNEECLKGYSPKDPNYTWWKKIDLDTVYRQFNGMLFREKIASYCIVLRMTSHEALSRFADESVDVLHIDGNHSEETSLADVLMYLPKLKHGGYLWFDDANWVSTNKATTYVKQFCVLDERRSVGNACLLFKKS